MKSFLPLVLILVVLIAGVGTFLYMTRARTDLPQPTATSNPANAPSPAANPVVQGVPGAEPPHAIGPADAAATIEEFGDFECPPCGLLHPVLKAMVKEFGPRLRVIFREYPLQNHAHALNAAKSAEAAGLQGKFWEMHGLLYENQKEWHKAFDARPIFEKYAQAIGLDMARYRRDLASKTVENRIFLDQNRAHSLGVRATPTAFLNGREVPFEQLAPEKLRVLIAREIAQSNK